MIHYKYFNENSPYLCAEICKLSVNIIAQFQELVKEKPHRYDTVFRERCPLTRKLHIYVIRQPVRQCFRTDCDASISLYNFFYSTLPTVPRNTGRCVSVSTIAYINGLLRIISLSGTGLMLSVDISTPVTAAALVPASVTSMCVL